MPTVSQIVDRLAETTRPENTPDWDPVGIQLGDPDAEVRRVAVCHEVTEQVVAAVESQPVDLLVTYHPLIFRPTTRLLAGRSPGGRAFRLMSAGAALLITHTDFDAAPNGTADALAGIFDIKDVRPFGGDPEIGLPPIGRVGRFDRPLGAVDAVVTDEMGVAGVRITGDRHRLIENLAVVPGSGAELIEQAAAVADALVTGDISHHRSVAAADLRLALVDPGHAATERPGMRSLVTLVSHVAGVDLVDLTRFDPQTWT